MLTHRAYARRLLSFIFRHIHRTVKLLLRCSGMTLSASAQLLVSSHVMGNIREPGIVQLRFAFIGFQDARTRDVIQPLQIPVAHRFLSTRVLNKAHIPDRKSESTDRDKKYATFLICISDEEKRYS